MLSGAAGADGAGPFLESRVKTLFRHIAPAMNGQEESIHQMRVAARRLRVTLSLVAPRPEGRRVRKTRRLLKKLARTSGLARDLDVCAALFEECVEGGPKHSREESLLRRRLGRARRRSRQRMTEALLDLEIPTLRRRLRRIVAAGPVDPVMVLLRVGEVRDGSGVTLIEGIRTLGRRFDPGALHELRRQARTLRYVAEVSAEYVERSRQAPRRLKVLQELLGKMHDACVLADWLDGQVARCRRQGRGAEAAAGRRLSARFRRVSRTWHERYLEAEPAAIVREARAAIGRRRSVA